MSFRKRLVQSSLSLLKVGTLGFGGPLATMAFMREELVVRHKLVRDDRYLEGLAVVKLCPGPVSTLLSIFLGHEIAGALGGFLGGVCFVLPSFLMLLGVALVERHLPAGFRESRMFTSAMQAIQVSVISVVLFTCWKLFQDAASRSYGGGLRRKTVTGMALFAAGLAFAKLPEVLILVSCAIVGWRLLEFERAQPLRVEPLTLFWSFFTAGVTVFGTGYMVLPHLQRVLVEELHWIDTKTFLDAVAWGNLTPGPVVIASTYMGYAISGFSGAVVATVGIFAGPFILMLSLKPVLNRILGKPWTEGVLLGLIPSVAATIAVGILSLARAISWDAASVGILALTLTLAFRKWPVVRIFGVALAAGLVRACF